MLPGSFASMLQNIVGGEYGVNPALIFNEGWMLRLLLYNHHKGVQCFPFPRDTKSRWFSEAQLPTVFKARHRGDSLAEKRTQIDGAFGHIKIKKRSKAWLLLDEGATCFNVLEAKMLSPLSAGLRNSPDYDQAARTVACMARTIEASRIRVSDMDDLGFYVIAPRRQIVRGVYADNLKPLSIKGKVEARIEAYRGNDEAYERLLVWKKMYFEPVLNRIQLRSISWEDTIERMAIISPEKAAIKEFYKNCLRYSR